MTCGRSLGQFEKGIAKQLPVEPFDNCEPKSTDFAIPGPHSFVSDDPKMAHESD